MLDGVTPFPAEFAARCRERGYWEGRPLSDGFAGAFATYADQVAIIDENGPVTYRELSRRSERLARVLLDRAGLFLLSGGTTGTPKLIPRSHGPGARRADVRLPRSAGRADRDDAGDAS